MRSARPCAASVIFAAAPQTIPVRAIMWNAHPPDPRRRFVDHVDIERAAAREAERSSGPRLIPPSGRPGRPTFYRDERPGSDRGWTCRTSNISSMTLSATLARRYADPRGQSRSRMFGGTLSASVEVIMLCQRHPQQQTSCRDGGGFARRDSSSVRRAHPNSTGSEHQNCVSREMAMRRHE